MANLSDELLDEITTPGEIRVHPLLRSQSECDSILHSSTVLDLFHPSSQAGEAATAFSEPSVSSAMLVQRSVSVGSADNSYTCTTCNQMFTSKSSLVTHSQLIHAGQKPFECSTCGKCFANSSYLSQHNRIHLGVKPYRCQLCDRRFTQLCHLQQHIRTHTGEKPYRCGHAGCTKAFSQLSNLQSHTRSHMTDKPFRCNSCYKCFGDERSLQEHIPKHTETKHLKTKICSICGKSYAQETYLARHMSKHEGTSASDIRRPLARQCSEEVNPFGTTSGTLAELPPSVIPQGSFGNARYALPSFIGFGTSRVAGFGQPSVGMTKFLDLVPDFRSPSSTASIKSSVGCEGPQDSLSLPYNTQHGGSIQ